MNIRPFLICAALAFAATSHAQEAVTVKVKVNDVKSTPVQTPQFQISNVPAKPYRPKNWLEMDVTFDAEKTVKAIQESGPFVDQLEFKYYVALNKVTKDNKYYLLTGTIIYTNIQTKEKSHALAFISPSALTRLLDKDFTIGDIKAVGVEVNYAGQLVGGKSTTGKFWDKLESFAVMDGSILPKPKTPFAPIWGDYDVEVKVQ